MPVDLSGIHPDELITVQEITIPKIYGVALRCRKTGTVWSLPRPNRHNDLFRMFNNDYTQENHPELSSRIVGSEQGFIDEKGAFLNRKEAAIVAKKTNQILHGEYSEVEILYSEDLW